MSRVICYVEGKSDRLGLEALFRELLREKLRVGIEIRFIEVDQGNRKTKLVTSYLEKAFKILRNDPQARVAVIPDLYPPNKGFPHQTLAELESGICRRFERAAGGDPDLGSRFHVFCFKFDFEVLILAAENYSQSLTADRRIPYEDLNHELPPKRRLERLFAQRGRAYNPAKDAPEILSRASYQELAERCPQAFGPFVRWLEGLTPISPTD